MKVTFKHYKCEAQFEKYADNRSIAIQLIGDTDSDYPGELIATATVNTGIALGKNVVGIKDYSENEGMAEALINAGIIQEEPELMIPTGFVWIPCHLLTEAAIQEVEKECGY